MNGEYSAIGVLFRRRWQVEGFFGGRFAAGVLLVGPGEGPALSGFEPGGDQAEQVLLGAGR